MGKYAVVELDDETGKVLETYGPFPGKKSADEWRLKTMEQLAGIVGSRKAGQVARANLKVVPMVSRGETREALAKVEKRGY